MLFFIFLARGESVKDFKVSAHTANSRDLFTSAHGASVKHTRCTALVAHILGKIKAEIMNTAVNLEETKQELAKLYDLLTEKMKGA